ncbi:MAG: class I SAM-dependent methyltransferase [Oscillospiraceae bacterium]|nr:class I SAM-dependent methyltransferase [Oscillospiraceae bacterium]
MSELSELSELNGVHHGRQSQLMPRLRECGGLVRKGSVTADIGTDHALLPIWLLENGVCPFVYASDINEKPLETARRNIERHGLSDKITVLCGSGLERIETNAVSDIVIAGMGGGLIAEILSQAAWTKHSRYRLILQPMSKQAELRLWLGENGFDIVREIAVTDHGKDYTVICAEFSGNTESRGRLYPYIGELAECRTLPSARLTEHQISYLRGQLLGAAASGDTEKERELYSLIEQLTEIKEGILHDIGKGNI